MRELVKNRPDKLSFTTSFTESSVEFIVRRRDKSGQRVTRAIQLAKSWNKKLFSKDITHNATLRSYAIELLISKIYDENEDMKTAELFLTMLGMLETTSNPNSRKDICFTDYFPCQSSYNPGRPLRIFDPCFPESDVVGDFEGWMQLAAEAKRTKNAILNTNTPIAQIFA